MKSIAEYHGLLRDGTTTVEATVRTALKRIDEARSGNALISVDADGSELRAQVLDRQRGSDFSTLPLFGVPFVIKDNIHVEGFANTAGTPGLRDFYPRADHPAVKQLRDAGAIILGKANLHELALGITSDNPFTGAVANAHDPEKIAGGSSGGTAAAIAGGLALAGLGTDTGGSVRIPAALNGICGLRPSAGRYSQRGVTPVSHTRDTVGPMGRTVADLALIDTVISGDPSDPDISVAQLRLGVSRDFFFTGLDIEVAAASEQALSRLGRAGITLVDIATPAFAELVAQCGFPIVFNELRHDLQQYLNEFCPGITFGDLSSGVASPDVRQLFSAIAEADFVGEAGYRMALAAREKLERDYRNVFEAHRLDALVFPTTALPARDIAGSRETVELNGRQVPTFNTYIRNTDLSSLVGSPGLSMPNGMTTAGLPVGLEVDAMPGCDRYLLAIGKKIQQILTN